MNDKPKGKPLPVQQNEHRTGRLGEDDRGNVTWTWANEPELQADDDVGDLERLTALDNPGLHVDEPTDDPERPGQTLAKGLKTGYNPYNSGALGKTSWKKKRDMRQLSKWIELRKKISAKKPEDGEE